MPPTFILTSKYALPFDLDIQEAVLLLVFSEEFAEVVSGPADLVADFEEEADLVAAFEDLEADVLEQHQDSEVVLYTEAD